MKKRREQRESKKKVEERVQLTSSSSTIQHALHNCRNSSVDRISDLPDELLIYILSFLPTKLAFTTAILSKRWTQLCYSLPIIDLSYKTITKCRTLKRFRCFVNNIMLSPVSTNKPMKIFRFKCLLRYHQRNSKFNVTKWLEAAKQRHIEEIHLSLPSHTLMPDLFVSQTLVVLKLESLYVGKGTSCVHLPSLKTLNLTSVYFQNWNNYVNFLYACPILEDLYAEPIHFIRFDENNASEEGIKSLTLSKLVRASIRIRDGVVNGINNVKFLRVLICAKAFSLNAIPLFENLISMELVFPRCSYICWDDVVELLRHCPKLQILFIEKVFLFMCYVVFCFSIYFDKSYFIDHNGVMRSML
ncbi:putative F-box domain, leucine-rich repeat domain, L domain-containing protein [Medicago truncatula]|uniref:Putative F-box domain, leucine-rich repeat domain, L domain-containing protein n=1 Tax=Medicago truncatula TaxID=3880 RepID=A0A396H003_MEDTR|nr:putative F-box domain, leucine-rich repeat domain, L domain-containing protein [Medicago truncatula]